MWYAQILTDHGWRDVPGWEWYDKSVAEREAQVRSDQTGRETRILHNNEGVNMAASTSKVALAVVYKDNGKSVTKLIAAFNGSKDATRFVSEINEHLKAGNEAPILAALPDFPKDAAGKVVTDVKFRAAEVRYNPSLASAEVAKDVLAFDL